MSLPSFQEKRLQEIRNFEECLQDGFELYSSGKSAIEYYFGSKTLKEIFEFVLTCPTLKNEAIDLAERLFLIMEKDISRHISNQLAKGLSREESKIFIRRLGVFWQIFELQNVDGLISDGMKNRMYKLLNDSDAALLHFKDKTELHNLPSGFVASLENLSLYDRASPILSNRLGRDESTLYMTDIDTTTSGTETENDDDTHSSMYTLVNTLLNELIDGNVLTSQLIRLVESERGVILSKNNTMLLSSRLLSSWWDLIDHSNIKIQEGALRILRFLLVTSSDRDILVHYFHELYLSKKSCLPSFTTSSLLRDGKRLTTSLINDMGSHDEMQRDMDKSERVLIQYQWLALISPEEVTSRLIQQCFTDRRIVAPSMKLLSSLPSICSIITPSHPSGLIMSIIIGVAKATDLRISEERDSLVYLIASMTRQKKNGSDKPVLSSSRVFHYFVEESLDSKVEYKTIVALSLLVRLFSAGETKHSVFNFSTRIGDEIIDGVVHAPELLCLLLDLMGHSEQEGNSLLFDLSKKAIKQMGHKLREDEIVFDDDTIEMISMKLSDHQWYTKVAVFQWFGSVLKNQKKEIPSGLLLCLSAENSIQFEQIIVSYELNPVECFLRSLYEVSIWDIQFALSFLDLGISTPPSEDHLADKISIAIVDVCNNLSKCSNWESLLPFVPLTNKLLSILDVSIDTHIETINAAIYHSIESQRTLNILARATKLAYLTKNEDKEDGRNNGNLLQLFCSVAKNHIEKEMESWRKYEKGLKREAYLNEQVSQDDKMTRRTQSAEYVLSQCGTLFPLTVSLTYIVPKVPSCLQTLLSTIADFLSEFYNRELPKRLDDMPTGSIPDTTVYAYAKGANNGAGDYCNGVDDKTRSKCSASNPLFEMTPSGRESALGTARAINECGVASMIEKKLSIREENNGKQSGNSNTSSSHKKKNYRKKK